jgi:hypothetical protein
MPFPNIFWVIANDLVMANDLDDLDGAEGNAQPPQGRELAIVDLATQPSCRRCRRIVGPLPWPKPRGAVAIQA